MYNRILCQHIHILFTRSYDTRIYKHSEISKAYRLMYMNNITLFLYFYQRNKLTVTYAYDLFKSQFARRDTWVNLIIACNIKSAISYFVKIFCVYKLIAVYIKSTLKNLSLKNALKETGSNHRRAIRQILLRNSLLLMYQNQSFYEG